MCISQYAIQPACYEPIPHKLKMHQLLLVAAVQTSRTLCTVVTEAESDPRKRKRAARVAKKAAASQQRKLASDSLRSKKSSSSRQEGNTSSDTEGSTLR